MSDGGGASQGLRESNPLSVPNRLTCNARWRPACKLLVSRLRTGNSLKPGGGKSRFLDLQRKSNQISCSCRAQQRANDRGGRFGAEKQHLRLIRGQVCKDSGFTRALLTGVTLATPRHLGVSQKSPNGKRKQFIGAASPHVCFLPPWFRSPHHVFM